MVTWFEINLQFIKMCVLERMMIIGFFFFLRKTLVSLFNQKAKHLPLHQDVILKLYCTF